MTHDCPAKRNLRQLGWCASIVMLVSCVATAAERGGVQITQEEGKLRVEIAGRLFTEYHYQNASRPFLHPILGPGGAAMTRDWPMKDSPGEERDHPHQKSFWWAHGEINGIDFWSESAKAGKTVHEKFTQIKSGKRSGVIRSKNKLVALDGTVVATDERTLRIHGDTEAPVIDFEVTVRASHGELTFGDTKEGTMALRLAESMRLIRNKKPGLGHIVNSEGVRDGETWGKRAQWCDYYGPVGGQTVGVAIFDHPRNPRYPTWWHVRDYGLFAANPFGIHDFEKKPPGTGNLVVPAGKSITFRYRVYFHPGDEKQAHVAERYQDYIKEK